MTGPQPDPDPRIAGWALRLRTAIGAEPRRTTHQRPTRVIARNPILAVIAEMEAPPPDPAPPPARLAIDPNAVPPTPPDRVHAERLEEIRDRCTHDLVLDGGMCVGCSRPVPAEVSAGATEAPDGS